MPKHTTIPADLERLLSLDNTDPLTLIRHGDDDSVAVYTGELHSASVIADIVLEGQEVIAAVPFGQIRERGFDAITDEAKMLYLTVSEKWTVSADELTRILPAETPAVTDLGFGTSDEEYAEQVRTVINEEIGRGEGANFVIRRDYRAHTETPPRQAALAWLRNLLLGERGAYWTFAFITEQVILVGASPERHVSAVEGTVLMNPISGTFRHGGESRSLSDLLSFLADRKESEELVMVVDEELKMMSAVCPGGGVMRGPFLKPMSRVTHTEYLLEGKSDLDPREILRLTMFAPTVTGSPMGNACTVIARHEKTGRGYYSGVLAHFAPGETGYSLDAPILIRTAELHPDGEIVVSAGATLVRHSDPVAETLETRVKASGVLTALGLLEQKEPSATQLHEDLALDPAVVRALEQRNRNLAPFWRDEQPANTEAPLNGSALIIDCGDEFTTMLAHQLRHLGMKAEILPWDEVEDVRGHDLVVFGPGPGDPGDLSDPRIVRLRELMVLRIHQQKPMIAVCLSHQILCTLAGLPVAALPSPRQGEPIRIQLMGHDSLIGFYNTFAAMSQDGSVTPEFGLVVHCEGESGIVHSLTGPNIASVQGHLESVLSLDGLPSLRRLIDYAMRDCSGGSK